MQLRSFTTGVIEIASAGGLDKDQGFVKASNAGWRYPAPHPLQDCQAVREDDQMAIDWGWQI